MTNKEIGERIRAMRLSRGMTQEELADAIGTSPSAVGMYEAGRRRPREEVAEALADAFNVPKWAIYYRENEVLVVDTSQEGSHYDSHENAEIDFALSDEIRDLSETGKKGVGWDNCREGSNPSFSAKTPENTAFSGVFHPFFILKSLSLYTGRHVFTTYATTYRFLA